MSSDDSKTVPASQTERVEEALESDTPSSRLGTREQARKRAERLRDWVLESRRSKTEFTAFLDGFARELTRVGVAVDWLSLHSQYLSPTRNVTTYQWSPDGGIVTERCEHPDRRVPDEGSLISRIWRGAPPIEGRLKGPPRADESNLVRDLKIHGLTHYLIAPVERWVQGPAAVLFATRRASGFSALDLATIHGSIEALGMAVELHETRTLTRTLLGTYLGQNAAERVLRGSIRRGESEMIHAILFYSDLRGFTSLSEGTEMARLTDLLDRYFETVSRPVQAAGGEILKFIGDGLLAVFPCPVGHVSDCPAAQRALRVAHEAQFAMARRREAEVDFDLECGIALHVGEVMFGNVGAVDRLDFTVIGPAVNLATRIEELSKQTEASIVVSPEFALRESGSYDSLGFHDLKGIADAREVLTPRR